MKIEHFDLSLREKVGQLFMVGFYGSELPKEVEDFVEQNNIGFVILFARNIVSLPGAARLTNHIHSLGKIMPGIWVDQEGGTVVQFKEMAATVISPMGIAATGRPKNAETAGRIIGEEMNACGIDGVFAPVLDVNLEEKNPIIGIRSFSDQPETVTRFAEKFCSGLNRGGVAACGKHFPGHGGATEDSHLQVTTVSISPEYFFHYCYPPFAALAKRKIDAVMTSHVRFSHLSREIATFSPEIITGILRKRTGYKGVVFTDCLEMRAVKDHYSPEKIVKLALEAGVDVLIPSHHLDFQKELLERLVFYVQRGVIDEWRIDESVRRVLRLKKRFGDVSKRKFRDPAVVEKSGRNHLPQEKRIAAGSITLLRNRGGVIPLEKRDRILILEWDKVIATTAPADAEKISFLRDTAEHYFREVEVEILPLDGEVPGEVRERLSTDSPILAGVYSRTPGIEEIQARALGKMLRVNRDIVVAALGNPYDIRHFPSIDTYVVTYGFRKVQVEALFEVLTGQIKAVGRLPVEIKHLFPRGYRSPG